MGLQFEGRLATGQDALDRDLQDLHLVSRPDGSFLYAGTGGNGGLSVFALAPDVPVQLLDMAYFTVFSGGVPDTQIDVLSIDGAEVLIAGTGGNGALLYYEVDPDGGLGKTEALPLPATDTAVWTGGEDGSGMFFSIDQTTGTIAAYDLSGDGVVSVASGSTTPGLSLGGVLMTSVSTAGGPILVASEGGQVPRLVSYRVSPSGDVLIAAGQAGATEGLGVSAPTALESVTAFGEVWVILAAAGSSTLSVLRVGEDGGLTPTDHVLDTLGTRFGGVQALSVVETEGHVLLFAGGADDGLAVFTLLPNGRLVHLQSIAETQGLGLNDVTAIEAARIGNEIHVFVASEGLPGLSQFSWGVATLGEIRTGSGPDLRGTDGDDLLVAEGAGTLTVHGGAGDDILMSGDGASVLWGEAGADIFVVQSTDATVRIADFQPGVDRLDLSLLPMLRSPDQLIVTERPGGVQLDFGSTRILVDSTFGTPLQLYDIWEMGLFGNPDRLLVEWPPKDRLIEGTDAAETLLGGKGQDTVFAGAGDDLVKGYAGSDELWGGFGQDTLQGGTGNDTLLGRNDADILRGGQGDDQLLGAGGADALWGGDGNDRLFGNGGQDTIRGGEGADSVEASGQDDLVWGGAGNDTLFGGGGNDTIKGGKQGDLIYGGGGHDILMGQAGWDTVWGGAGADSISGNGGNDSLHGDGGQDTLDGQAGRDDLRGGNGADTLDGGTGNDILHGDAGADVFVFGTEHGNDEISDFVPGEDLIRMDGIGFTDLNFVQQADGTELTSPLGTIFLAGLTLDQLSVGDFLFF